MKVCSLCGFKKLEIDFTKDKRTPDGLGSWCKECKRQKDREYRNKNIGAYSEKAKWKHKRIKYGVSKSDFDLMLEKQEAKCLICNDNILENPHIDHNHKNGEIRGLLCKPCNRGLGFFKDNPMFLKNAYQYLIEKGHYGHQAS